MYEKPNPAELLKEWMKEYETRIRELQSVSAYLGTRVDRLERSSSPPAPSPAPGLQAAAPFLLRHYALGTPLLLTNSIP